MAVSTNDCVAVNCVEYRVFLRCSTCYVDPVWYKADVLYVVV